MKITKPAVRWRAAAALAVTASVLAAGGGGGGRVDARGTRRGHPQIGERARSPRADASPGSRAAAG